jgi:hypothetical protein
MSFSSKVLYTGDGVVKSFNIPFPYLSASHLGVYVDEILQLNPMNYTLSGPSTVLFSAAPGDGSAIVIRRSTSPTAILVDFQDGSVLSESDLDTGYLHNYYLGQEYADSFNEVINEALVNVATGAGIVETETDEVIAALVNEMLNTEAAANLQARITDIDANAEAIVTLGEGLQTQINTLAQGVAAVVYVQDDEPVPGVGGIPDPIVEGARWYDSNDNNKPYIYQSSAWVSLEDPRIGSADADVDVLQVQMDNTIAAIVNEQFVRATGEESFAQQLGLVGSQSGDGSAFIINLDTTHVTPTESLADRFTSITADWTAADAVVAAGATAYTDAEISTEQTARANGDSANASDITALDARVTLVDDPTTGTVAANAAQIVIDRGVAASATSAVASDVTSLTTEVDANTATVATHATSINGIEAEYGVDLTVNGYIQGFRIINGGTPGANAFVILADKFAIVDASGDPAETQYVPFEISGGKINMRSDVQIDGNLMVSGTINGTALVNGTIGTTQIGANAITTTQLNADSVTAAKIASNQISATHIVGTQLDVLAATTGTLFVDESLTMNAAGHIKGGQTAYDTGTGFFLGYSSGAYKFSLGNTANFIKWDGTSLEIVGDVKVGVYIVDATETVAEANTERTKTGTTYTEHKKFTMDREGEIRVSYDYKCPQASYTNAGFRVKVNGVTKNTLSSGAVSTYTNKTVDLTGANAVSVGDEITIEMQGGQFFTDSPEPGTAYIKNAQIRAVITIPGNVTVNTD